MPRPADAARHTLLAWVAVWAALWATTGGTGQARAQTPVAPNSFRVINLNYVYAAELGFGGYTLAGLTAGVYTLPLTNTLHDLPYDGWALKLLLPFQAGIYSFRATDTDGSRVDVNQQSISVLPGLELQVPLTDHTMLKPFGQFGEAHGFGPNVGNPDSWVYITGVRALTEWRAGDYTLSLGNAVVYAGDDTIGPGFAEHYVSLQIGAEVRRPLGFEVHGVTPDIGLYVADYYYPTPLAFSRFLKPVLHISNQAEIGFSIGSATPFQLLWLSNPRIGIGFVFGGGLDLWHINFGFQF